MYLSTYKSLVRLGFSDISLFLTYYISLFTPRSPSLLLLLVLYADDVVLLAETEAASANSALGLIISKFYPNGSMPNKVLRKVYESLVAPAIENGAATIWGTREFSCINAVQNMACRVFLGLGRYAPNAGFTAESLE